MLSFFRRGNGKPPPPTVDPFEEARLDPHSFGNLALERGYITLDDLEEALKVQKDRLKLGDILVEMGALTLGQREELLLEQELLQTGKMGAHDELELCRLKKRNRILAMKEKFAEARGNSEALTKSVMRTLLSVETGE